MTTHRKRGKVFCARLGADADVTWYKLVTTKLYKQSGCIRLLLPRATIGIDRSPFLEHAVRFHLGFNFVIRYRGSLR